MMLSVRLSALVTVATLCGCGSPNDPGVGGVTKAEAEQLNEAAESLNQNVPPPRVSKDAARAARQAPAS
jgi:hypothetical protein